MSTHELDRAFALLRIIVAMTALALLLTMCGGAPANGAPARSAHADHASSGTVADHASSGAVSVAATDFSIYDVPTLWRDQSGALRDLASFAGRPQVIAMLYTHCGYSCPLIIADMKRIEGMLREQAGAVGFVIVSIDPSRDTVGRLAEFGRSAGLDPARWTLLTAESEDAVLELAAVLGVRYRRISDTELEHSNVITILDAGGRIVHRQTGLSADPTTSVTTLRSLLALAAP